MERQLQIGKTIRMLRQRDQRTQTDLAGALGISPQAVSRWETGLSFPDMTLIPSIARYFGVPIDALFGCRDERDAQVEALHQALDNALWELAKAFADTLVQTLMHKQEHQSVQMLKETVRLLETVFAEGNAADYHETLCSLFLCLSVHQWRCGSKDNAFDSLDSALEHAKVIDAASETELAKCFPMRGMPGFDSIYAELTADVRRDRGQRTREA